MSADIDVASLPPAESVPPEPPPEEPVRVAVLRVTERGIVRRYTQKQGDADRVWWGWQPPEQKDAPTYRGLDAFTLAELRQITAARHRIIQGLLSWLDPQLADWERIEKHDAAALMHAIACGRERDVVTVLSHRQMLQRAAQIRGVERARLGAVAA